MPHVTHIGSAYARRGGRRTALMAAGVLAVFTLAVGCSDDDGDTSNTKATIDSVIDTEADGTADGEGAEVLALMAEAGLEVDLDDDQLQCIDEVFAGVDLSEFDETFDPFGNYPSDDVMTRTGQMFDDCLEEDDRMAIVAASMLEAELGDAEQVTCAAKLFEGLVIEAGTYEEMFTLEIDVTEDLFDSISVCGIDLGGDEDASGDTTGCEAEQRLIETAIEAYFVENSVDAESFADLVPDYIQEDPSERFELVIGDDRIPAPVGINECDGYGG